MFDREYRTDDAEPILAALQMVKGVLSVKPHVADFTDYSARERIRAELSEEIWGVLHPQYKKK